MESIQLENQLLRKELLQLKALLAQQAVSPAPSNDEKDSSDEEIFNSGLRLASHYDLPNSVEIENPFVDNTQKMKKKKKRRKNKKNRNQRKPQQKPISNVPSEPEIFDVIDTTIDANSQLREAKRIALNAVRKFTSIEVVDSVTEQLIEKELQKGQFNALYFVNLGAVVEKYIEWITYLPRVQPLYAMKSNPDINIIRVLHSLGAGFDCASMQELSDALSVGARPQDIIYANPCKGPEHIRFAKENKIDMMTFDNLAELDKIHSIHPNARLVLRILPDDSKSLMPFGLKFGASLSDCRALIARCKELNLNLIGLSFHVGSGCFSSEAFVDAVLLAKQIFGLAEEAGFSLNLLDLGGGWPGVDSDGLGFSDIAKDLAPVLDEHFPSDVRIVAEPGRYFCAASHTLAVSVISRRERWIKPKERSDDELVKEVLYYLSDGLYGSFNCIIFDHAHPQPVPLRKEGIMSRSCCFGPTCDSMDVICKDLDLVEMEIGDWIYFPNMGAYTLAAASSFNGFKPPNVKYLMGMKDGSLSIS